MTTKRKSFLEATRRREERKGSEILEIAKKHSTAIAERGDLETRNNDNEDFIEISVWNLKAMLQEAYEAGKQA